MFDSLVGDGSPVAITIVAEMEARTGIEPVTAGAVPGVANPAHYQSVSWS